MFASEFIWCDLSTFDLAKAVAFYKNLFGWTTHTLKGSTRDEDYTLFYAGMRSSAGIFTMSAFFQSIGMPSFWMSYVRVEDLDASLDRAVGLGAKCEIEPTAFDARSRFALIRDPSGAGFTLYEGPDLKGRDARGRPGCMVWNELHIPSLDRVASFYRDLFDWDIAPDPSSTGRHTIHSSRGTPIASILELDEAIKGPKNYWAVYFAVRDISAALRRIRAGGGSVLAEPATMGAGFALAADDQGAAFCLSDGS